MTSINDLRRTCDYAHDSRGPAEVMFWTLGAKPVGRAAIAGWAELLVPALDRIRLWPFEGALSELCSESAVVVCETFPSEFYGHLGLPRMKTAVARATSSRTIDCCRTAHRLDEQFVDEIRRGFENDDAYDAFVGLVGMLNVVQGFRPEAPPLEDVVRRVEGWMLGRA